MKKLIFSSYLILLLLFNIFSYLFIDPNFFYLEKLYTGYAFQNRTVVSLVYVVFIFFLFIFYYTFIQKIKRKEISVKEFIFLISSTVAILLFSYPTMLSYDIFNYLASAKVLFFYHENPYIIMPTEFIKDPTFVFVRAANKTALYAPTWILSTGTPYVLGFGNYLLTLLNFKLFVGIFYLLASATIYKLSKSLKSTALFALNPLVVIECLVSGHNDIFMITIALLAFYLINRRILSLIFFIFSVFVKFSTLFLLPTYLLAFKNRTISKKIFFYSALLMFAVFVLSPLREELYPWYAIWFLPFLFLASTEVKLVLLGNLLCMGLLLSYVPYMYLNTYLSPVPILKTAIILTPVTLGAIYIIYQKILKKKVELV